MLPDEKYTNYNTVSKYLQLNECELFTVAMFVPVLDNLSATERQIQMHTELIIQLDTVSLVSLNFLKIFLKAGTYECNFVWHVMMP